MAKHTLLTGNWPGRGGTHSADQKLTRMWRNALYHSEIDQGHGRTHSANWKLTRNVTEHTLLTGNWPGTQQNTLCWPIRTWRNALYHSEIDQGHGRTHSDDWKWTRDKAEHTLLTGNWLGRWWNTLLWLEINLGHSGTHSADQKLKLKLTDIHDPSVAVIQ